MKMLQRTLATRRFSLDTISIALTAIAFLHLAPPAEARIARITITRVQPAYGVSSFGAVNPYQLVTGVAYGDVDPKDRRNAIIQDIDLAPRNAKGMVEYSTNFGILMPADAAKGNRTMLFEIVNRGRPLDQGYLSAGDAFLENQGFTVIWAGWQADMVMPPAPATPGPPSMPIYTMSAPVATNQGQTITGLVRAEWIIQAEGDNRGARAFTQNISLPDTNLNTPGYPTATLDNTGLTLTTRVNQNGARTVIPTDQWAFADCASKPFPGTPDPMKVCLKNGFDNNHIYELVYTAKNPIVMGLGLAAIRDVGSFFRNAAKDDNGTANPLAGRISHTLVNGISQSGRTLRTFLQLGFNEDEQGRMVYEGAQPHIAAAGIFLNVRFSQPARLAGTQHTEKQYPGPEFPVTYGDLTDPLTGKTTGLLDSCTKTKTCPKIIHTMTDTEYWQSSGRSDTTDALGKSDIDIPDNVRIYQFSSNQHGGKSPPSPVPTAKQARCEQLPNANTYTYNNRAMIVALKQWVADGTEPPPSRYSRISDGTLVLLEKFVFPKIPGVTGPEGVFNTRVVYDRGPRFDAQTASGIIDKEPPVVVAQYPSLVPQVDADGNDVGGVRSHILQAPLGTYTGWNARAAGWSQGDSCDLVGGYIPFAILASDRMASGDPRLSLQERYANTAGYVKAVTAAVNSLVSARLMLAADAAGAISTATTWFTQASKGKLP